MFKLLLAGSAVTLSALLAGGLAGALWLISGGVATVAVATPDVDLWLPVPTRLIDVGLDVALLAMPEQERRRLENDLEAELGDFDLPEAVRTLSRELRRLPDGEYVAVRNDDHRVWVGKRSGDLQVEVDAPDARVRVSVPARAAGRVSERVVAFAAP